MIKNTQLPGYKKRVFNILCKELLFECTVINWRGMNTAAPSAVHNQLGSVNTVYTTGLTYYNKGSSYQTVRKNTAT